MSLLTILNNWRIIMWGGIASAFAVLFAMFKYKSSKLEKAEHEIKIKDKKAEITKIQSEQKKTALEDEHKTIEEQILNVKESRHNDVNSL